VAHEIKNPLTPISIGIDDLKAAYNETPEKFAQTLDETVRTIKHEVNRMKRLLDQFSAFARMAPPKIIETPVTSILEKTSALYKTSIDNKMLSIITNNLPQKIKCDPEQVEQLLINLIKNGLESSPDSRVELVCDSTPETVTFAIRDTGPGFDAGILANPFEPYVSTKKDGSGLGLVICRRIVHDHGGTIELKNRPEGGAEVIITLPR
jgi:nitrogen fixation/metabolism regulation signal transduction histidine kinase